MFFKEIEMRMIMFSVKNSDFIDCVEKDDLFEISTTYEGKTEVVCRTNLECVAKIICQLFDVNYSRLNDDLDQLSQFIFRYVIKVMTYKEVKGIYLEFPLLAQYQGTALVAEHTIIDTRNAGVNNKYFLILVNVIYGSIINATVKFAGNQKEDENMKLVFEQLLPENKGMLVALNDFYDGYINESDLTEIIKSIRGGQQAQA